ncbi:hypothetical protein H1R20_g6978, partial [Candolleomyces eurysporus]
MQKDLKNADLAFLSACQTSAGEQKLSEEAVHLAAGMLAAGYRRVVATMWAIGDRHAPEVAKDFYDYLFAHQLLRRTVLAGPDCKERRKEEKEGDGPSNVAYRPAQSPSDPAKFGSSRQAPGHSHLDGTTSFTQEAKPERYNMPRKRRDPSPSSSSSDNEAPEAVTLTQSKQNIQQREHVLRQARLSVKEKQKEKNRELDKKLKERAEVNRNVQDKRKGEGKRTKGKTAKRKKDEEEEVLEDFLDDGFGEGVDFGSEDEDEDYGDIDPELEARMLKAMRDAEEEDGSEDSEFGDKDDEGTEDGQGVDSEDGEEESVEDDEEDEDDEKGPPKTTHLPDELFQSAFQQTQPLVPLKSKFKKSSMEPSRKRRQTREPKELSASSKKIRLLPNPSLQPAPNPPSTMPSKKVNKFLDRSLALKGRASKPKLGWERRPANIGLLRSTNGPAAHFVRNNS